MKVEFDRSFLKSLGKIKDENVLKQVEKQILKLEAAKSIKDIANLKNLRVLSVITACESGPIGSAWNCTQGIV